MKITLFKKPQTKVKYTEGFFCLICMEKITDDDFIEQKNIIWNEDNNRLFHKTCQEKEEMEEQEQRDNY